MNKIAINFLVQFEGLIRPFGRTPGASETGHRTDVFTSKEVWDNYQWNPPQYFPSKHPYPDSTASQKPTWDELVEAYSKYKLIIEKERVLINLDYQTTMRIAVNYHPKSSLNPNREWQVRLSGEATPEQDRERIRLIARHNEIEAIINTANLETLLEIESLLAADEIWTSPNLPDDFAGPIP